jgi:hypothetical protein
MGLPGFLKRAPADTEAAAKITESAQALRDSKVVRGTVAQNAEQVLEQVQQIWAARIFA